MTGNICGAKAKGTGRPCQRPAGWGTDHVGTGRCKLHGGASPGGPIKHGRYSVKHRQAVAEKYQAFLNDPEPGSLMAELAMMRALFQDYLDRFEDGVPMTGEDFRRLFDMLDTIGKLVERIHRIVNEYALTAAEVRYLQARFADLVIKYIGDADKQRRFLAELQGVLEVTDNDVRESKATAG